MKALEKQQNTQERKSKKNRALFKDNNTNETSIKKIQNSEDPKIQSLSERFSSMPTSMGNRSNSNKNLKLNAGSNPNKSARRSLDSIMGGSKPTTPKTPVGLTLDDFVVKSAGSKQNKKKKNRKSEPLNPIPLNLNAEFDKPARPIEVKKSPFEMERINEKSVKPKPGKVKAVGPEMLDAKPEVFGKSRINEKLVKTIEVRRSPEKRGNAENQPILAKMTPDKKREFDKSEIWASITNVIDKTPKLESVPKMASPLKTVLSDDFSEFIEPQIEQVTNAEKLEKLALLYKLCIHLRLVPNILVEIYSIFQILTVKDSQNLQNSRNQTGLLTTVHNCVYFATKVMLELLQNSDQMTIFDHLDRATLVLLVENPRFDQFCPEISVKLATILSTKKVRHSSSNSYNPSHEILSSVRFQTETDARDTFPDCQTFQDFKKQRDLFYEILRNWKGMAKATFSASVEKLLKTQEHPENLQHFAKLFHDQMLSMCLSEADSNDQQGNSLQNFAYPLTQ